uniref:RING-type E3 ubiquitin transferase n=1 Tax=Pseudonaja textilis TaxID=8673 RepID=A0A670ZNK4_PSETE
MRVNSPQTWRRLRRKRRNSRVQCLMHRCTEGRGEERRAVEIYGPVLGTEEPGLEVADEEEEEQPGPVPDAEGKGEESSGNLWRRERGSLGRPSERRAVEIYGLVFRTGAPRKNGTGREREGGGEREREKVGAEPGPSVSLQMRVNKIEYPAFLTFPKIFPSSGRGGTSHGALVGRCACHMCTLIFLRLTHQFPECLSDSENEEPFQCRPVYRSAFVSKGSAYSVALLAGNFSSKVERSQSCNDTLGNRSKSRQRSAPVRTKVNPSTGASVSLVGVLSSTQNNRCLSAPDLTAEKRLASHQGPASFPAPPRQERSISPESNDSISEELNHFKPIVCSPCTPPKQLPDGRVLSPLIIKSTPRNLTRSLQKPTTYEASPRILKKWEQILQERQVKKMLSKATLTTSVPEPGEDFPVPNLNIPINCPLNTCGDVSLADPLLPRSLAKPDSSVNDRRASEATELTPRVLPLRPAEKPPDSRVSELPEMKSAPRPAGSCLRFDAKTIARKVVRVNAASENGTLGNPAERKPRRYWDESGLRRLSNGLRLERGLGEETPSLRRGQKRPCKTKHLDPSVKRLRPSVGCRKGPPASDPLRRQRRQQRGGTEQRLEQEEADRRLAVQLQRQFEREIRIAERPKGRADQYFLRSKNATGTK